MHQLGRLLFLAFPLLASRAHAQEALRGQAFWHQAGGTALRRNACEAVPVRAMPELLWSLEPGAVTAPPVVWGQVVFATVQGPSGRKLQAYSIVDGSPMGAANIDKSAELGLAAWDNQVVVVQEKLLSIFAQRGKELRAIKLVPGDWRRAPLVHDGWIYASSESGLHAIEMAKGREAAVLERQTGELTLATGKELQLVWVERRSAPNPAYDLLEGRAVPLLEFGKGKLKSAVSLTLSSNLATVASLDQQGPRLLQLEQAGHWAVVGTTGLVGFDDHMPGAVSTRAGEAYGIAIDGMPAMVRGGLYGFSQDGVLIHQLDKGGFQPVVEEGDLPAGAKSGPVTAAQDVLYVGNWAVSISGDRKVLWVSKDVPRGVLAMPLGDRSILYVEPRKLSAWGERGGGDAVGAAAASAVAPARPDQGDGVLLVDGTFHAGQPARLEDGRWTVAGVEAGWNEWDVALVQAGTEARLSGTEQPLEWCWRKALGHEHRLGLVKVFEAYHKAKLVDDCRRLREECVRFGASKVEQQRMDEMLAGAGQSTAANAAAQRQRVFVDEKKVRAASSARARDAMSWCAARGWTRAASALAGLAREFDPDDAEALAMVRPWIAASFPWRDDAKAAELWVRWSPLLAPSEGEFVAADDPLWTKLAKGPWARDKGAIALRSRNLLFISRTDDAETVGGCLRQGEQAIRVLELLMEGNRAGRRAKDDTERLEVRLHKNRKEYVLEHGEEGAANLIWTAGYFVPAEDVSRFFVPDQGVVPGARERNLYSVVAHELTHHYLDVVWNRNAGVAEEERPKVPGFWVVEGMADFVEEQTMEHERVGGDFDDPTVPALDVCSVLHGRRELYKVGELLGMTQIDFARLHERDIEHEVKLRHSLQTRLVDATSLFYSQSAALVHYLMHKDGSEGRRRFIAYMRAHYQGATTKDGWRALGRDSAQALHVDFEGFLSSLGK